jgi:VWFA-related protein
MTKKSQKQRTWMWSLMSVLVITALLAFPAVSYARTNFSVAVHYVLARAQEGTSGYDVNVYVTLINEDDKPIKDVELEDFTVNEDNNTVEVSSADLVSDDPIDIVLLIDTSSSMSGANLDSTKSAASEFIDDLERDDQIALMSFDDEFRTEIDFTSNHDDVQNELDNLEAKPNSGTCMYDAIYNAVESIATMEPSRRAIIVMTDGVDETPSGGLCSIHNSDDVIDLATTGSTRVPIDIIGLSDRTDQNDLERISTLTGGRYRNAATRDDLSDMFDNLSKQIHAEYVLKYVSTASPGDHTILVEVDYDNVREQDTRDFSLPEKPVFLTFNSLAPNQEIQGMTTIEVTVGGNLQGKQIKEIVFTVNDTEIGRVSNPPYRVDYDFNQISPGSVSIAAIAKDTNDEDITRSTLPITVLAGAPTATQPPEATPTILFVSTPTSAVGKLLGGSGSLLLIGGGIIGLLVLGVIVIVVVVVVMKKKSDKRAPAPVEEPQAPAAYSEEKTMDGFAFGPQVSKGAPPAGSRGEMLGVLRIHTSEDPAMAGQVYNITKPRTTIGRGADNDLILPKEKAVSRHHAMIELTGSELFLSEIISQEPGGGVKRPTYGTFVNGQQVGAVPIQLQTGDEIRLGTQLSLQFEKFQSSMGGGDSDKTLDGFSAPQQDRSDQTLIM